MLDDPATTEIVVQRPSEVGIERHGQWSWRTVEAFDIQRLDAIGLLAGSLLSKPFDPTHPICIPSEDSGKPDVTGFNVLGWIDITHPEAELHVRSAVSWIYDEAAAARTAGPGCGEDPFFAPDGQGARHLFARAFGLVRSRKRST